MEKIRPLEGRAPRALDRNPGGLALGAGKRTAGWPCGGQAGRTSSARYGDDTLST